MSGLQDLPFEILEHICKLIAVNQPRNLIAFSQVSKLCLATSSQSLWHTVPLRIVRRNQVQDSVNKLRQILDNRLSRDGRVRCISIRGRKSLDEESGKRSKLSQPERAQLNNLAWQPLADILTEMPPLSQLEWEQHDLPPCILHSLNSHHHGCMLRMAGVRPNTDKTLDPHERPAATSSFMYEVSLPLDEEHDLCGESLSGRGVRDWHGIRVSLATIGKLSGSLVAARHPNWSHYWAKRLVHQPNLEEFELPLLDSEGPTMRYRVAALSTLDLSSEHESKDCTGIRCDDITMWSKVTRFSTLRILKSGCNVDRDALKWMTKNCSFASLKALNMGLHSERMLRFPSVLVDFLCSLPPLEELMLTGEINPSVFKNWIPHHAPMLRRLALEPEYRYDSAFDLESLSEMIETPLPLLERLSINIKRTKGDSDETSIYKIFGSMPKLQSIVLRLDCSDRAVRPLCHWRDPPSPHRRVYPFAEPEEPMVDFWQRIWLTDVKVRDIHPHYSQIRDALINSAVDTKLAKAIFATIQTAKPARSLPLERLEVRPSGGCDFGGSLFRFSADWSAVMQHIERSWLVQRQYPGLGSSVVTVNQLRAERSRNKCRLPKHLRKQAEAIFRKVWPVHTGAEGDWQKDWHSFPLAK